MTSHRLSGLVIPLLLIGGGVTGSMLLTRTHSSPKLLADERGPLTDTDGDLLPDTLEWLTLSNPLLKDTDGNGVDDFVEAVQHITPFTTGTKPLEDEVRVLLSATPVQGGTGAEVYVHMLFRFVGNRIGNVQQMTPYIALDSCGKIPAPDLITGGPVTVRAATHPTAGTLVIASVRLCRQSELLYILPCTVGAQIVIDGKLHSSGTYVGVDHNTPVVLLPVIPGVFINQPLNPEDNQSNPFWNTNSVCAMKFGVVGSGMGGSICEVECADCEVANGLRCAPLCRQSVGKLIFVPDGLATITGG